MKKILLLILAFVLLISIAFAGTGKVTGTLMVDNSGNSPYYYIELCPYSSPNSLQSQVFAADPTQDGYGIWYDGQAWQLDNNKIGQHITITSDNISNGLDPSQLLGKSFTFTYQTDSSGIPVLTEFNAASQWLVVVFNSTNPELIGSSGEELHTSIGVIR
ncbi:MAG: hypothetical protein NTX05_02405 [Fusobacteria bacterium]|nr:hypothetical protein [Fusobacteriota bacterium]